LSIEPERRAELLKTKLIGIVKSAGYDATEIETEHNNSDSVLLTKDRCWVLAEDENPQSVLGKGIFLLTRNPELELCVVFEDIEAAGIAARQAIGLKGENKIMYFLEGKLTQVSPTPFPDTPNTPTLSEEFEAMCRKAGVSIVCENGIWRGEILGLEVVRVDEGGIQVGVGRFDREAGELLNSGKNRVEQLIAAANQVRIQRTAAAGAHPLATLSRERWLRHKLLSEPEIIGLSEMTPIDSVHESKNLKDFFPAAAIGTDEDHEQVLCVCSVGIDIGLIPLTAELASLHKPGRIVIVLPPQDMLPLIIEASHLLNTPSTLIGVDGEWACPTRSR